MGGNWDTLTKSRLFDAFFRTSLSLHATTSYTCEFLKLFNRNYLQIKVIMNVLLIVYIPNKDLEVKGGRSRTYVTKLGCLVLFR